MLNQRSINPEKEYDTHSIKKYNSIYVGFVVDSSDTERQAGRITVWIPDISANRENTFVVQYCSFFAGASNIDSVTSGSKTQAQQSYGWWGVPPDINNMVVVAFINGDPARGIWFGCLYQEYMTNMIPNIPESKTTDSNIPVAPTLEYNKKDEEVADSDDPYRPIFTPLYNSLVNQGLIGDPIRGPAQFKQTDDNIDALSSKQQILGLLTPGGSQIVYDDSDDNKHIRFRTENGTQIIINDTVGFIYLISRSGNSWAEISDDGVNVYSNNDISFRSQSNINFHADGNINFNSVGNTNIASNSGMVLQADTNINVLNGSQFILNSGSNISILSDSNVNLQGTKISLKSDSIALTSGGEIGINSSGTLYLKGSQIQQNNSSGPTASKSAKATGIKPTAHSDVENKVSSGYSSLSTKTIVSVLPSHEPWSGHPTTNSGVSSSDINTSVSTPSSKDNSDYSSSSTSTVPLPITANSNGTYSTSTGTTDSTTITSFSNDTTATSVTWTMPCTGTVTSLFGNRGVVVGSGLPAHHHDGVDIGRNNTSPVYAARSGTVIFADYGTHANHYYGYGNAVMIDHGDGLKSLYAHLSHIGVSFGDKVSQNQQIGNVGGTGAVSGPCLHWEIRKSTQKINPSSVFSELGIVGSKVVAGTKSKN